MGQPANADSPKPRAAGLARATLASLLLHGVLALWLLRTCSSAPAPVGPDYLSVQVVSDEAAAVTPAPFRPAIGLPPPPAAPRKMTSSPVRDLMSPAVPAAIPVAGDEAGEAAPAAPAQAGDASGAVPAPAVAGPADMPAPRLRLAYLSNPPPDYPMHLRLRGVEGRALIRVVVDADGRVLSARVHAGSGDAELDAAALAAVSTWRFTPLPEADSQVAIVPIGFSLKRPR